MSRFWTAAVLAEEDSQGGSPFAVPAAPAPTPPSGLIFQYELSGVTDANDVSPPWFQEDEPYNPGPPSNAYLGDGTGTGIKQLDRIRMVSGTDVPGNGTDVQAPPNGRALRFEIRDRNPGGVKDSGDVQISNLGNPSEYWASRSEVQGRQARPSSVAASAWPDFKPFQKIYVRMRYYVPEGFAFDAGSKWRDVAQFKSQNGGSPVGALAIDGSHWSSEWRTDAGAFTSYDLGAIETGKWVAFDFEIFFSPDATGANAGTLRILRDGVEALAETTRNTMQVFTDNGQTKTDPMYLKQGIYRDSLWTTTDVLYIGETVIAYDTATLDELDPLGTTPPTTPAITVATYPVPVTPTYNINDIRPRDNTTINGLTLEFPEDTTLQGMFLPWIYRGSDIWPATNDTHAGGTGGTIEFKLCEWDFDAGAPGTVVASETPAVWSGGGPGDGGNVRTIWERMKSTFGWTSTAGGGGDQPLQADMRLAAPVTLAGGKLYCLTIRNVDDDPNANFSGFDWPTTKQAITLPDGTSYIPEQHKDAQPIADDAPVAVSLYGTSARTKTFTMPPPETAGPIGFAWNTGYYGGDPATGSEDYVRAAIGWGWYTDLSFAAGKVHMMDPFVSYGEVSASSGSITWRKAPKVKQLTHGYIYAHAAHSYSGTVTVKNVDGSTKDSTTWSCTTSGPGVYLFALPKTLTNVLNADYSGTWANGPLREGTNHATLAAIVDRSLDTSDMRFSSTGASHAENMPGLGFFGPTGAPHSYTPDTTSGGDTGGGGTPTFAPLVLGAENIQGWGTDDPPRAKSALGVNGDRITATAGDTAIYEQGAAANAANGISIIATVDAGNYSVLDPASYADDFMLLVDRYGTNGTNVSAIGGVPISNWAVMNEPWLTSLHGGTVSATAYAACAAAVADRFAALTPGDAGYGDNLFITLNELSGNQGPSSFNADVLAAQPDLYSKIYGFDFHWYGDPATPQNYADTAATKLDPVKVWAWTQTNGNNKPFVLTEANVTAENEVIAESVFSSALPAAIDEIVARPWIERVNFYAWHSTSAYPYLGFCGSPTASPPSGDDTINPRCTAVKAAIVAALA